MKRGLYVMDWRGKGSGHARLLDDKLQIICSMSGSDNLVGRTKLIIVTALLI